MNHKLQDVQAGFRKGRGTRDQIANIYWVIEKKQESSRKTFISVLLTMPKTLCGSQQTLENSSRDENTRPPDLPPEKSVCRSRTTVRIEHGTIDWFQIGERSPSRLHIVTLPF